MTAAAHINEHKSEKCMTSSAKSLQEHIGDKEHTHQISQRTLRGNIQVLEN